MKTFAPNGAMPRERAVTSAGEANGQTNHAARKGRVIVGLYQQMKMIVLHAEVHHANHRREAAVNPRRKAANTMGARRLGNTAPGVA